MVTIDRNDRMADIRQLEELDLRSRVAYTLWRQAECLQPREEEREITRCAQSDCRSAEIRPRIAAPETLFFHACSVREANHCGSDTGSSLLSSSILVPN